MSSSFGVHSAQTKAKGLHAFVAFDYPNAADRGTDTNRSPSGKALLVDDAARDLDTGDVYVLVNLATLEWRPLTVVDLLKVEQTSPVAETSTTPVAISGFNIIVPSAGAYVLMGSIDANNDTPADSTSFHAFVDAGEVGSASKTFSQAFTPCAILSPLGTLTALQVVSLRISVTGTSTGNIGRRSLALVKIMS